MISVRMGRRRGMTLIEVLIAVLIVGICIATMVSLWSFAYTLTGQNDAKGTAYNIGRRTIERIKQAGFSGMKTILNNTPNATNSACLYYPATNGYVSTLYYDQTGSSENTTQGSRMFSVTAYLKSAKWTSDTPQKVADDALIEVEVTVTQLTGQRPVTYKTGTYLVRSGV